MADALSALLLLLLLLLLCPRMQMVKLDTRPLKHRHVLSQDTNYVTAFFLIAGEAYQSLSSSAPEEEGGRSKKRKMIFSSNGSGQRHGV